MPSLKDIVSRLFSAKPSDAPCHEVCGLEPVEDSPAYPEWFDLTGGHGAPASIIS